MRVVRYHSGAKGRYTEAYGARNTLSATLRALCRGLWLRGKDGVAAYLSERIEQGHAISAKRDITIAGYLAWMYFDFHSHKSAFCPIVGHAAAETNSLCVYRQLYQQAAQTWVSEGGLNHLWMLFKGDSELKDMLYELGFGSHVIDAYAKVRLPADDQQRRPCG